MMKKKITTKCINILQKSIPLDEKRDKCLSGIDFRDLWSLNIEKLLIEL